jgi:CysZ protein
LFKELTIAIQAFFKAHQLITYKNNYKWLLLTGLLYAILFTAGLFIFYKTSTIFTEALITKTNIKNWLQSNNDLLTYLFITSIVMFNWVLLLYYFSLFKYIYLIICSPAFSYISLKTTTIRNPKKQILKSDIVKLSGKSIVSAVKNLGWQTVYFMVFLVLSLIPVIGWIIPIIALITEFYFYGYATVEYKLLQKGMHPVLIQKYLQNHKGLAIGNGLAFYILHLVPILGWIAAPVYSIIASNLAVDLYDE